MRRREWANKKFAGRTGERFNPQAVESATVRGDNRTMEVRVKSFVLNPELCNFGDVFGCNQVMITLLKNASIFIYLMGINLQSTQKTVVRNGNSHQENAADPLTLAYARDCLQNPESYFPLNVTIDSFFGSESFQQACAFALSETPKHIITQVRTTPIPQDVCAMLAQGITAIVQKCENEASKKAAELMFLFFLLLLIPAAIYYFDKKCGSPLANCLAKLGICKTPARRAYPNEPSFDGPRV